MCKCIYKVYIYLLTALMKKDTQPVKYQFLRGLKNAEVKYVAVENENQCFLLHV